MSMSKKYLTEALLLTRSYYPDELECWLEWYLNILGFDHIVIFDNDSTIDVQEIIKKYKDRVSYRFLSGWPNQHKLYSDYIKESESQWLIPVDDDEFLYIGDKFNGSVKEFIQTMYSTYNKNKYYSLWVCMVSKEPMEKREGLFINTQDHYSYEAFYNLRRYWGIDNRLGKCFVNTDYSYVYGNHSIAGHIPECLDGDNTTVLVNGNTTNGDWVIKDNEDINKDCFIAHYHTKSKEDWIIKCNRCSVRTGKSLLSPRSLSVYDRLYQNKALFKPCTLLKDRWNNYLNK